MFSVNMHRVEHKVMCVHFTEQVKKTNTSARTVLFVPSEMEAELPVRGLKQSSGLRWELHEDAEIYLDFSVFLCILAVLKLTL